MPPELEEELLVELLEEELLVELLEDELLVELLEEELLELEELLDDELEPFPPQDSTKVQELSPPGTVVVYQFARYLLL